jgi:hypothetical protein
MPKKTALTQQQATEVMLDLVKEQYKLAHTKMVNLTAKSDELAEVLKTFGVNPRSVLTKKKPAKKKPAKKKPARQPAKTQPAKGKAKAAEEVVESSSSEDESLDDDVDDDDDIQDEDQETDDS